MEWRFLAFSGSILARSRAADAPAATRQALRAVLDDDLRWLADNDLRAILTLTEEPLPAEALRRFGLSSLHLPVRDLTAPTLSSSRARWSSLTRAQSNGIGALVHCLVGQGRTGTILAAYLVRAGSSPTDAIQRIRALRPGSIESSEQERAIAAFARRRDWII